jgi:hypothetical protein
LDSHQFQQGDDEGGEEGEGNGSEDDEGDEGDDNWETEEDDQDDDEGDDDPSKSDDSDSQAGGDFLGENHNLDNQHNRQWYCRKTLQSRFFPFRSSEHGLMLAWDTIGKKISRRKMDSLLAMIADENFDARNLKGFTAKRLRGLAKRLPLLKTESIPCTKIVIKKVFYATVFT